MVATVVLPANIVVRGSVSHISVSDGEQCPESEFCEKCALKCK